MHMIKTWDDNKFGRETNFAKIYIYILKISFVIDLLLIEFIDSST